MSERQTRSDRANVPRYLWHLAKRRAGKRGLEFTIEQSDIVVPERCPILDVPLAQVRTGDRYTPSLDRIDATRGYVPGNVRVVSEIANRMKSNATADEMKRFADYVYREVVKDGARTN